MVRNRGSRLAKGRALFNAASVPVVLERFTPQDKY